MMQLFAWVQLLQLFCLAPLTVAVIAALARRLDDVSAMAAGTLPMFFAASLASYYYVFLILLLLANRHYPGRLALLFSVEFASYYLQLFEPNATVIYLYRSALVFWLIAVLLLEQLRDPASNGSKNRNSRAARKQAERASI